MRIERIDLSVFETTTNTGLFEMREAAREDGARRWVRSGHSRPTRELHVLHVFTDDGIEGVCTVGDARYITMRTDDLEQLRLLAVGEDPLERERLYDKCKAATRGMFTLVGWHGAFDNCLWDIAGKAAGVPVADLIGRVRDSCPAYYNYGGATTDGAVDDARQAMARGFGALKDHFTGTGPENESWFATVRAAVGDEIDLLHDAASCDYGCDEALRVAEVLHDLRFGWFEEPLDDRDLLGLQRLCAETEIPILAPETLMNDVDLSAAWLRAKATDKLRVNGRIGTTAYLQLARLAAESGTTVEPNGPGGLFGHVHAHLCCACRTRRTTSISPAGHATRRGARSASSTHRCRWMGRSRLAVARGGALRSTGSGSRACASPYADAVSLQRSRAISLQTVATAPVGVPVHADVRFECRRRPTRRSITQRRPQIS